MKRFASRRPSRPIRNFERRRFPAERGGFHWQEGRQMDWFWGATVWVTLSLATITPFERRGGFACGSAVGRDTIHVALGGSVIHQRVTGAMSS